MSFRKYHIVPFMICLLLAACSQRKQLPSMKEGYGYINKAPFGTFIAYERVFELFREHDLYVSREPFSVPLLSLATDTADEDYALYLLITRNLYLTDREVVNILQYVKEGNDFFISADYIDSKLMNALFCEMSSNDSEAKPVMKDTHVGVHFSDQMPDMEFGYYYFPFNGYLQKYQKDHTRVLGVNEQGLPNYVVIFLEQGRLYLHLAPRALSNYFLMSGNNYQYLDVVLNYLRLDPEMVYWDEYYKHLSPEENRRRLLQQKPAVNFSSFGVIMKYPSLRWAFFMSVLGLVLFVLFSMKRKQQPVPLMPRDVNESRAFAKTLGQLYGLRKNNKYLAEKMIHYIYENSKDPDRHSHASTYSRKELTSLKLGAENKNAVALSSFIKKLENGGNISDVDLLTLNKLIENYKLEN